MILRLLGYLILIAGVVVYHVFHSRYFSWLLLLLVLVLPVMSLITTLLLLYRCRIEMNPVPGASQAASFALQADSPFTGIPIHLRLRYKNLFTGEKSKEKLVLLTRTKKIIAVPLHDGICGVIRCQIVKSYVRDLIGLLSLPLRAPDLLEVLILPEEIPYHGEATEDLPGDLMIKAEQMAIKRTGEREMQGIREYRYGDTMRDISWKLSARHEKLMVREYEKTAGSLLSFAVLWGGTPEELHLVVARLLGIISCLADTDQPYTIFWLEKEPGKDAMIYEYPFMTQAELESLLWDVLARPVPDSDPLTLQYLLESESLSGRPILKVVPDAIVLYQNSNERGAANEEHT